MTRESIKKSWKKGVDKIRETWEENPVLVIGVTAAALTAAAKFIDAVSSARSRRAYARQVDFRVNPRR